MQSLHRVFEFTRLHREYLESQAFNVYRSEEEASAKQQSQRRIAVFDGLSTLQAVVTEKDAQYLVNEGGATLLASVGLRIQQQRDRVSSVLHQISEENGLQGGQDRRGEAVRAASHILMRRDDKLFIGLAAPPLKSAPKTLIAPQDAHVEEEMSNNKMKAKGVPTSGRNAKGQPSPTTTANSSTKVGGAAAKVKPTGGKQQGADIGASSPTLASPKKKPFPSENAGTKNSAADAHKNNSDGTTVGTANPSSEAAAKAFSSHAYDVMQRALRENPSVLIRQMSDKEREKVAARIVFAHVMMSSFDLGKIEVPFCVPQNHMNTTHMNSTTNIAHVAVVEGSGETNDTKKTAAEVINASEWSSHNELVKALSISLPLVSSAASSSSQKYDQNGQPSLLNSTAGTTSNNFVSGETAEYFRVFLRASHPTISHNPKEAVSPLPTVQLRHIWALLSAALLGPDGGLFWATSGVVNPKIRREYTVITNKWPSEVMAMARRDALANSNKATSSSSPPPALGTSQIPILPNHLSAADGTMLRAFELAGEKEMSAMLTLFDSIVNVPSEGSGNEIEQKEEDHREHQKEERDDERLETNLNSYSQQPIRLSYLHEKLKALDDLFNFFLFATPEVVLSQLPINQCKEEILYRRHWLIVIEICMRFLIHPSTSQSWADFNNPWLSENMPATSAGEVTKRSPALHLPLSYLSSSSFPALPLAPPVKIVLDAAEGAKDHAVLLELLQDAIEFCGGGGDERGEKERDTAFFDCNASLAAYIEELQTKTTTEESCTPANAIATGGGAGATSKVTNGNNAKAEITTPSPAQLRSSYASAAIQKITTSRHQRNKMSRRVPHRSELCLIAGGKEGREAEEVDVRSPLAHWGFNSISQEQVATQLSSANSTFSLASFRSPARPQPSEHNQIQGRRRPNSSNYSAAHRHFLSSMCIPMASSLSIAMDKKAQVQIHQKGGTDDDHLVDDRAGVSAIYGHANDHAAATNNDRTSLINDGDEDAGEGEGEAACPFAAVVEAAAIALERLANYTMRATDPSSPQRASLSRSYSLSHTHWGNRLLFLRFLEYQVKAMAGSWRSFTMLQRLGVSIRYSAVREEKLLTLPSPSTRAHSQDSSATSSARTSARSDRGNVTPSTHQAPQHMHSVPPTSSFAVEVPPLTAGAHRMASPPPLITRRIDTMSTKALNAWAVALGLGDEPLGSLLTAAKQKVASSSAMAENQIISAVFSELSDEQKQKVTKETLSRVFRQLTSTEYQPIIDNGGSSSTVKMSSNLSLPMFISTRLSRYFKRKHDLLRKWDGLLASALEEARVAAAEEEKALAVAAEEGRVGGFNSNNSSNAASAAGPPRVPLHAIIQTVAKSVMLSASKFFTKALGVNEGMAPPTTTTTTKKSEKVTAGATSQSLFSEVRLNNQNILAALPTAFTSESCCPNTSDGALLSPAALAHLSGVSPYAFCSPILAASYSALFASSTLSYPLMFTPSPSRELCSLLELVSLDLVLFGQGGAEEEEKESVGKGVQIAAGGEDNEPTNGVGGNASTPGLRDELVAKLAHFFKASNTNSDQSNYSFLSLVAGEEAVFDVISGLGPLARVINDVESLQREQEARVGDAARDTQQQQQQTQPQPQAGGGGGTQASVGAKKTGGAGGGLPIASSSANNATAPPASPSATTAASSGTVGGSGGILQSYGSGPSFPEFSPSGAPITVFRPRGPLLITSPLPPQKRHLVSAQLRSEGSPYAVHTMSSYFVLTQLLPKHTLTLEGVGWGGGGLVAGALYDNIERIKRLEAEVLLLGITSVSFPPPSSHTVMSPSLALPIRPVCAGGPAGEALRAANTVLVSEALAAAEKAGVGIGLGKESQQGQGFGGAGLGGNVRRGGGGAANAAAALAQSPTGGNPAQQRPLLGCVAPLLAPTPHVSSIPLWMPSTIVPSIAKLQRSFSLASASAASPSLFLNSGAQPLTFKSTTQMRRSNFGSNSPSAHNAVLPGQPEERDKFGGNDSTASVGGGGGDGGSPSVVGDSTTSPLASPKANANKFMAAQQALRPSDSVADATELEFYSVSAVAGRSQGPACNAMREEGARILLAHLSSQCERMGELKRTLVDAAAAAAATLTRNDEECEVIAGEVSMLLVRLWRAHMLQRVLSTPEKP